MLAPPLLRRPSRKSAPHAFLSSIVTLCRMVTLQPSATMASLLAALGDVERSSQNWAAFPQASFSSNFPQRVNTLSKPNSSRGMKNSSGHKTSASRKSRSIHAPFVKKNRSWNDSTYNCMNVYPHMESMEMGYCEDCSPEDENLMSGYEDEAIEGDEGQDGFDNGNSMLAWTSAELTCD